MSVELLEAALAYLRAGISIIPCTLPTKQPDFRFLPQSEDDKPTWEPWTRKRVSEEEVQTWFDGPNPPAAIGIICGAVSGNLEIIDIDDAELIKPWTMVVRDQAPGLLKRVVAEETLRGRAHIIYRCSDPIPGNQKLAKQRRKGRIEGVIETRGEGGYAVVAPTPGYTLRSGRIENLTLLYPEERETLIACARAFHQETEEAALVNGPKPKGRSNMDVVRPGDEFNREGDVRALLQGHGWVLALDQHGKQYWRRPGKERGWSASWNYCPNAFHVFSSNASPFEEGKTYSPFAMYALLECSGDYTAAAKDLRAAGYGAQLMSLPGGAEDIPFPEDAIADQVARALPETTEEAEVITLDTTIPTLSIEGMDDRAILQCALQREEGLGRLLVAMFKNRLVFDNSSNTWHRWAGHYWAECRLNEQYDALVDVSQLLRQLATKHRKAHKTAAVTFTNGADSLQKLLMQNHVLQCATNGVNRLRISGDGWDQNGWLLGCPNGTLELDTGTFRPGRPEDYIKTICPTEYDPDATAPRWEQFIREIMPDPDIAAFLHRLLGYGITGRSTEHIFPVFWGESSRNGKGTLLETIGSVMGALAKPLPAKALMAQQFQESHDAQAMMLRGRRLLWGSETGDRQLLDTARVKQWTGGDSISGRAPYARTEVNFPATHKLVLLTNYKPRLSSDDKAMWNRMLLVPFRETFIDAPDAADPHQHLRDHELMDKLKGEKQGILRWLVQGCSDWHSIGLLPPKVIRAATASYQTEEDFLATFLAECTTPETEVLGNGASSKETYERFKSWSLLQGEKPIGQRRFLLSMDRRGVQRTHTRQGARFIGFRLNAEGV